ncbi:unnamed protein product [Oppiella nova]|uniref:PHD finger protein 10 n=1 Tax=Oppiella nova TaxID=334625 RepID=A0A7R9MA03_9ACAR|nr:unnamed protein product [Oppiella nova]CAG2172411.1 unnamed protein product [Oppiella nova]
MADSAALKKAMKAVTEYNRQLNQERREDRRQCIDLQTYTINHPLGLGLQNKSLRRKRRRMGRYPIALFHNHYQDWYMKYSSEELKYFPLNTVLYGPISDANALPPLLQSSLDDTIASDSDVASDMGSDDESSCSCGPNATEGDANDMDDSSDSDDSPPRLERQQQPIPLTAVTPKASVVKPNAVCKVCKMSTKAGEELLHCSDCDNSGHPSCLEFTGEMIDAIRLYQWQCMDCKTCVHCGQPHDEDRMMFCDKCDRGYHTFCVGLKTIPHGRWVCLLCANCGECGAKIPAPVNQKGAHWQHEVIKILSPTGETMTRHQVLCHACYKTRKQRNSNQ